MAAKKVHTVLGLIDPDQLGFTLAHEHLSLNGDMMYIPPTNPDELHLGDAKVDKSTYQWISQNPLNNHHNLIFNDADSEAAIIEDLKTFKSNGGGTIVELSSLEMNRKHSSLKKFSIETKVNVVAGAGFYTHKIQDKSILGYSVEKIAGIIRQQMAPTIQDLKNENNIMCGIIGEVGTGAPIHDFEKNSVRASAIVQSELKCPIFFRPPANCKDTLEAIRIYEEEGGRSDKLAIAHIDWPTKKEEVLQLVDENKVVYLTLDNFGFENLIKELPAPITDQQRIDLIKHLVKEGHEDRILLSHDVFAKHKLIRYGGHGFSHLVCNIPKMMREQGVTTQQIAKFTVENPKNWLAY